MGVLVCVCYLFVTLMLHYSTIDVALFLWLLLFLVFYFKLVA